MLTSYPWARPRASARLWAPALLPTLVVAPHPDDESLTTGGVIAHLRRRGVPVTVLAVTDGESSYPDLVDQVQLAHIRRNEQISACAELGLRPDSIWRAVLPDGAVAEHTGTLTTIISRICAQRAIEQVIAPWTHDHHSDHEACGRAALEACHHNGIALVSSLFWAFHHTNPDLGQLRLVAFAMSKVERERKQRAIARHLSQTTDELVTQPILDAAMLEPINDDNEFFLVPDGDS
ncbi:MAG: PIG-L deacetylase family protein [Aquihabitans sp.]